MLSSLYLRMKMAFIFFVVVFVIEIQEIIADNSSKFPDGFLFGAATSSYQIEGAWNESGKGENIWDRFSHTHPELILDHSNGDTTCDSYHRYKEDVKALKDLKADFYRFSLSWARILPEGHIGKINPAGIKYYHDLINELLDNGIKPMVTLYHWDLPQYLQDMGGWTNRLMVNYFVDYARLCFREYGDKVKLWITFNEPVQLIWGYDSGLGLAPGFKSSEYGYLAGHTVLLSHAKVYRMYHQQFGKIQRGKIGISIHMYWHEPLTQSSADIEAAERGRQFNVGWFAHPIFSKEGDYPSVMRKIVDQNSKSEGRSRSRLPYFTSSEIHMIKGSSDFFGLNSYTTYLISYGLKTLYPSRFRDSEIEETQNDSWPHGSAPWLKVVPWGFRKIMQWLSKEYKHPEIFVTENGYPDDGEINDTKRISYYGSYMNELLKAIHIDRCRVVGYTAWSLLDNYEWNNGYTVKFGLYHVNFTDPRRKRTAKQSSFFLRDVFKNKRIPDKYLTGWNN